MTPIEYQDIFTQEALDGLFPPERADAFFDALYGDADEGAYNIRLVFIGNSNQNLRFEFHLNQRRGKCLACNLTYGLPEVFRRHPIINIKGLVDEIGKLLDAENMSCKDWSLKSTKSVSSELHVIPLVISLG